MGLSVDRACTCLFFMWIKSISIYGTVCDLYYLQYTCGSDGIRDRAKMNGKEPKMREGGESGLPAEFAPKQQQQKLPKNKPHEGNSDIQQLVNTPSLRPK